MKLIVQLQRNRRSRGQGHQAGGAGLLGQNLDIDWQILLHLAEGIASSTGSHEPALIQDNGAGLADFYHRMIVPVRFEHIKPLLGGERHDQCQAEG